MLRRIKWMICFCLMTTSILCALREAQATSLEPKKFCCPVCGKKFTDCVVVTYSTCGGQDADLFTRTCGINPIGWFVHYCPRCFYAGYGDDFDKTVKFKDSIKTMLKVRLAPPPDMGLPTEEDPWPAWVVYEQVARTYQLLGKPSDEAAWACLRASWCVRYATEGLPGINDTLYSAVHTMAASLSKDSSSILRRGARKEVAVGRELSRRAETLSNNCDTVKLLTAFYFLRCHGENEEALTLLPCLEDVLPRAAYDSLTNATKEFIALERRYQRLALDNFLKAIVETKDFSELPMLMYLAGEMERRLGNYPNAVQMYTRGLKQSPKQEALANALKEQLSLVDGSGGNIREEK